MPHQYTCDICAFRVRSEDDDELVQFVQTHASDAHDMDVSRADVQTGWEDVQMEADD